MKSRGLRKSTTCSYGAIWSVGFCSAPALRQSNTFTPIKSRNLSNQRGTTHSNDGYHNKNTGFRSYFICFDSGARLEIMSKPGMLDDEKDLNRTGYAHVAFSVGSRERVNELTSKLRDAGYAVVSGPRTTGDGYYESCIVAVEGNQIEITV